MICRRLHPHWGSPLRTHALVWLLLAALCTGCLPKRFERTMTVGRDTFAFPNELKWVYTYNPETGQMEHRRREPPPQFAHRCVPMAVAARKFLFHATFDPQQPVASQQEYARLVKKVLSRSAAAPSPPEKRVDIPGYTNLYEFSQAHEALLKQAIGGAWQSYLNKGNLRMVFPFSRRGQEKLAERWEWALQFQYPLLVHVVTFPKLTINHMIVLTELATAEEAQAGPGGLELPKDACYFKAYDPNTPQRPLVIWYDRHERRFYYPRTEYFPGGPVNCYEVRKPRMFPGQMF